MIDDDRAIYENIADAFVHVEWFRNAQSFLGQLALSSQPGAIVVNVRLPDMDGLELVQRLRELGHMVPVIVVAEDTDVATAVRAIRQGADDFLEKRNSRYVLVRSVRRLLESEGGRSS